MIDRITPVLLTFNESPNIERTLGRLAWARDVVVVDSRSTDDTLDRARAFPNVRTFVRPFDSHAAQWNWAVTETGIRTDWVLALDADYVLSEPLVEELRGLDPGPGTAAYEASFVYCVLGRRLRGSVYPPVSVLYRRDRSSYVQDGHTQRIRVDGEVRKLAAPILHDDRKPLDAWLRSQHRYMRLEARVIRDTPWGQLRWPDRLRKARVVAPWFVLAYCLIVKRGLLDGRAGWFYALQRLTAETILSMHLLAGDLGVGVE